MGKMLPVDYSADWNGTDVFCCVCGKAFGGLIYDSERNVFVHRDINECADRLKKSKPL